MTQPNDAKRDALRRRDDLRAIAATPAGRRFFQDLVSEDKLRGAKFQRNADDAFHHGRRDVYWQFYRELREALSREAFFEIVFPKPLEDMQ